MRLDLKTFQPLIVVSSCVQRNANCGWEANERVSEIFQKSLEILLSCNVHAILENPPAMQQTNHILI